MTGFRTNMARVGRGFDAAGAIVIAGGVVPGIRLLVELSTSRIMNIRRFRQDFGTPIVIGLEFLVVGDIIRTVVVAPSLENVVALAIIV